jgi:cell division protease FtsH
MPNTAEYSDATSEVIDEEIKKILDEQYEKALEILRGKKEILDKGAAILLEREKIDGEELKSLMIEEASEKTK